MTTLVWRAAGVEGENNEREVPRKRRVHKKSRKGCRNCKLRSVKCDETTPGCQKCSTFGVTCNYNPSVPDLQMSITGTATITTCSTQKPSRPAKQPLSPMLKTPTCVYPAITDNESTFQLDSECLDRLGRFQNRTVLSVGTKRGAILYQKIAVDLTCLSPPLMHVVQALTSLHDRYLSGDTRQTIFENYHLSRAAALFSQKLSAPLRPSECDAVWFTSALLGLIAICSIETSVPEEAWPLKQPDPSDLKYVYSRSTYTPLLADFKRSQRLATLKHSWIQMSKNKSAVWSITRPYRSDSCFHPVVDEFQAAQIRLGVTPNGIEGIPIAFIHLFNLNDSSTPANNPYYTAVHDLTPLIGVEYDQAKVVQYLTFLGNMKPELRDLLKQKDPRALLLMAYWYAAGCNSVWWIEKRAKVECRAICIYLELYHADEEMIQELLQFPKMHYGHLTEPSQL